MTHEMSSGSTLPVNACLIRRAERLSNDPARGWLFSVMVRASLLRLETGQHA